MDALPYILGAGALICYVLPEDYQHACALTTLALGFVYSVCSEE